MTISINRFPAIIPSALTLLVVLLFNACSYINKPERKVVNRLAGTWKLDSTLEKDGKYRKVDSTNIDIMIFDKDLNYEHNHLSGDARGTDSGRYAITILPNRALASISLVPYLQRKNKDTLRKFYNFDIAKLTDSLLYKIDATSLIEQDDNNPAVIFNKHSVYKRIGKR